MPCTAMSAFVAALFFGLKAAVLAIVLDAVMRIGQRALKNNHVARRWHSRPFSRSSSFNIPFPLIILAAGVIGFYGARAGSAFLLHRPTAWRDRGRSEGSTTLLGEDAADRKPSDAACPARCGRLASAVAAAGALLASAAGPDDVFSQIAVFF